MCPSSPLLAPIPASPPAASFLLHRNRCARSLWVLRHGCARHGTGTVCGTEQVLLRARPGGVRRSKLARLRVRCPAQRSLPRTTAGLAGLALPVRAGPVPEYPARVVRASARSNAPHATAALPVSGPAGYSRGNLGVLWGTRGDGCRAAAASRGSSCPRRSGRCRRNCVPRDHATAPSAAPPMCARSSSSAQRYPRRRSCDAIGCDGCRCAAARAGALRSLGQSSPTSRLRRGLSFRSARTTSCHSADVRPAGRL